MKKTVTWGITLLVLAVLCVFIICTVSHAFCTDSDGVDTVTLSPAESSDGQIGFTELVGPWQLDGENNDLAVVTDAFPGYGEWGAMMEVSSDGSIFCYIGAIGGSGTVSLNGDTLTAELKGATVDGTSGPQDWTVDFKVVPTDGGVLLEMKYEDTTVLWSHGEAVGISGADPAETVSENVV